ncbi:MAG: translation initiation factor IF-2, partial [Lachnospiraceae bacterium]|nr:translation initiation factor IF-2 [Lachnospiraceae bacterium]
SRPQAPAHRTPIKPLTPPSPTPSVQMVSNTPAPKAKAEDKVNVNTAPARNAEAPRTEERPARNFDNNQRPQGERGERGNFNRSDRPQGDRNGFSRPQGERGERGNFNRSDRPQGDRNGFSKPQGDRNARPGQGRPGDKPFGDRGGRPGQGGNFRDNRNSQGRPGAGKDFAADAPGGKDVEKRREDEKRRFSQEKDKKNKKDFFYEEDETAKNKPGRFIKPEKKKEEVVEEQIKVITLPETITIKDLADKMKVVPSVIVKKLFMEGKIVTVNQEITYEDAENIAMEYDILCEKEVKVDVIEELLKEEEEDPDTLVERPPVICVMGHVDHGKTSLLDAIRKTNVTDREAGGITQAIGAYTVEINGKTITFLDTPGHEAFTAMRMRGANSTDIAILVVAADDGVMPQTVEAISHAKAAGIEVIVAVNKIDKPSANIDRVKQELTEYGLIAEDWGGSTVFVPVSAKTGEGISSLLEMILLTADVLELKANPKRKARGLVIEAELDKGRGPVATVLVQKGTLHVGDFISAGASHGKVRAMVDDKGRRLKEAGPSTPVEILGLNDVPEAGEVFIAHDSDKQAKSFADTYLAQNKEKKLEETKGKMSLDDLFSQIKEGNLKELNIIVKADVQGSVEALKQSLTKLSNEEVVVKCIHGGVGAINESDVVLASASNAIIIGFNVRPDATAKATAEREGVDLRLYKVIYQAIEDMEAAMKGMLDPVYEEKVIGHAEVRQIFKASAIGNIAGAYVLDGIFQRGCKVRITREGEQIFEGDLASLKRFKDDVKEVKAGFECGLVFDGFDKMQEFDTVEAYIMVEVPR